MAGVGTLVSSTAVHVYLLTRYDDITRLGEVINEWRKSDLNLEPIAMSEGPFLLQTLKVPFTYCWSPALVPKPDDWPANLGIYSSFPIRVI